MRFLCRHQRCGSDSATTRRRLRGLPESFPGHGQRVLPLRRQASDQARPHGCLRAERRILDLCPQPPPCPALPTLQPGPFLCPLLHHLPVALGPAQEAAVHPGQQDTAKGPVRGGPSGTRQGRRRRHRWVRQRGAGQGVQAFRARPAVLQAASGCWQCSAVMCQAAVPDAPFPLNPLCSCSLAWAAATELKQLCS